MCMFNSDSGVHVRQISLFFRPTRSIYCLFVGIEMSIDVTVIIANLVMVKENLCNLPRPYSATYWQGMVQRQVLNDVKTILNACSLKLTPPECSKHR